MMNLQFQKYGNVVEYEIFNVYLFQFPVIYGPVGLYVTSLAE